MHEPTWPIGQQTVEHFDQLEFRLALIGIDFLHEILEKCTEKLSTLVIIVLVENGKAYQQLHGNVNVLAVVFAQLFIEHDMIE